MLDVFFVLCRFPMAVVGTILLVLFGAVWFLAETPLAFLIFPLCAAVTSRTWLEANWPGTYPVSLKWFFSTSEGWEKYETRSTWLGFQIKELTASEPRGGLRLIADMWTWVVDFEG